MQRFLPFFQAITAVFAKEMPILFAAQMAQIEETHPAYGGPGTAFSSITLNKKNRAALHKDAGDLPQGYGVMTALNSGIFDGCKLVFPRYGIAVRYGNRDVLFIDSHEVHGNMPILGVSGMYERISCICYYRTRLAKCLSPAEESEQARRRKKGDPLRQGRHSGFCDRERAICRDEDG